MGLRDKLRRYLSDQPARDDFVVKELDKLKSGSRLLDAGSGSQRYRKECSRLIYFGQDFCQYVSDDTSGLASTGGRDAVYTYGKQDYVGDIWDIKEKDNYFDAILCTEVLEHIPYPISTIKEFSRLLRPGGRLILTAPSNCLRHMDPFYFYGGFSDRFFQKILLECGFEVNSISPDGDYYSWMYVEIARTAAQHSLFAKIILAPAFLWYAMKKKTPSSVSTLCKGYHVVATKTLNTTTTVAPP
jgi:SAM-dependent methyltransferase